MSTDPVFLEDIIRLDDRDGMICRVVVIENNYMMVESVITDEYFRHGYDNITLMDRRKTGPTLEAKSRHREYWVRPFKDQDGCISLLYGLSAKDCEHPNVPKEVGVRYFVGPAVKVHA